ncbi:MAG: hypothetical protein NTW49_13765 [Bacteroidia bacterium]|nr:hypothetical protein [Bacteroidia bacterium]
MKNDNRKLSSSTLNKSLSILSFVKFFILFMIFQGSSCLYGQGQANIWYFGHHAGLDFNSGSPIALTNGNINNNDGCASISDSNGNLLFYSDGFEVWNANHNLMSNTLTNSPGGILHGGYTPSQLAIIPLPGNYDYYYFFDIDIGAVNAYGISYSLVDMTLNNGLGDIVLSQKSIPLYYPPAPKITAVRHKNGRDVWVITHEMNTNNFRVYLITDAGLNPNPIITSIGVVPINLLGGGYIKASPDGKKVAVAHNLSYGHFILNIFDFDNFTGLLSNCISDSVNNCYGVEFSPDSKLLYVSQFYSCDPPGDIFQYNLTAGTPASILASKIIIATNPSDCDPNNSDNTFGAMQLAPDHKIYIVKQEHSFLSVINYPDSIGLACSYVNDALSLEGKTGGLGLPGFLNYDSIPFFSFHHVCFGDTTSFEIHNLTGIDSVHWNFNYPLILPGFSSTLINNVHFQYPASGPYNVCLVAYIGSIPDTIIQTLKIYEPHLISTSADTSVCPGSSFSLTAQADNSVSYLWSGPDGFYSTEQNPTFNNFTQSNEGQYFVTPYIFGCAGTPDTITVSLDQFPISLFPADTTICNNTVLLLDAGLPGSSWLWSTGETTQTVEIDTAGSYSVVLTNICGSSITDTINIHYFTAIQTNLPDSCYCYDPILDAGNGFISYQWSTGETTQSITAYSGFTSYYVTVTDSNGCVTIDSTYIYFEGINENPTQSGISIYYDNNAGIVYINSDKYLIATLELFNNTGLLLKNEYPGKMSCVLETAGLASGNYFIKVSTNGNTSGNFRFILLH